MSVITISRGSYSKGKEVAEKVASRLGYRCLSRDIILQASKHFSIPEMKLVRAIHDAPSILSNLTHGKERYISYVKSTLLREFCKDSIVYHGLAGHFFVTGIPHVLKVRIISDMEDRVRLEMDREGLSRKEAIRILKKDDEERRKWSKHLYGIDPWDPSLYDLLIHIREITTDDAADLIYETAMLDAFQTTDDSQNKICDLALSAEVKSALVDIYPEIEVSALDGIVSVKAETSPLNQASLSSDIRKIAESNPQVKGVETHVLPVFPFSE